MSLNEKISAWFEPVPTDKPDGVGDKYRALGGPGLVSGYASGKGVWEYRRNGRSGFMWQPLDYLTDEAANARLLEAMPSPMLFKSKQNSNWVCRPDYGIADYSPEHADRKIAVRKAFCKFVGIEEDE